MAAAAPCTSSCSVHGLPLPSSSAIVVGRALVTGLNWYWIALELTLAPAAGLLLAYPLWRKGQAILGNIAGTVAIFGTAIGLIFREYAVLDRATQACLEAGYTCWPNPSAFTRFAI